MHDIVNAIFYAMIYLWEAHEETRRLDGVWPPNITCHSSGPDRMSRAGTGQWRIFFANGSSDPVTSCPGREADITPVPRQAVADPETELEVSSSRLPWYQKRLFIFNYLWVDNVQCCYWRNQDRRLLYDVIWWTRIWHKTCSRRDSLSRDFPPTSIFC